MSQPKIKRSAFHAFKARKRMVADNLKVPHPCVTVMTDRKTGKVLCVGTSRARLMEHCASEGWDDFDMNDFFLVI